MDNKAAVRRGRPRNFDRDEALQRAMQVFWAHGYEGTSMTQLIEAMGIASPSIYAAFGSKEQLFREAVDLYVTSEAEPSWGALDRIGDVRQALRTMLFASIDLFVATDAPRGCLVILGATHLGTSNMTVRTILRNQRGRFRDRLVKRLTRAIEDGDLSGDTDLTALADAILAFFSGLAIEAVDGATKAKLRAAADLFCQRLLG
ncbi:TetR/AcrR family transcriptional regulator [uncultured Martelella sp.]|uniref:TetR/AcrR family transcriptional regulator n=1 Tax=uncultured Martelella sp. TaxID=392331 RepID=UPI0029C6D0A0|nr:TetR/AcrR family transcriptional regulator [uncultured Martelella sp.]